MKKIILATLLLAIPVLAAENPATNNRPLPQDTQIKLLKAQRQAQQIQLQMNNLQRQYDEAVKQLKELQTQMVSDCAAAAKEMKVDEEKYTCDLDSLTFAPKAEEKKTAEKK